MSSGTNAGKSAMERSLSFPSASSLLPARRDANRPLFYRPPHAVTNESHYFHRLPAWQKPLIKEIHLFTQLYWLEQSFPRLCGQDLMQNIEKLKITIRRGDWWWNERNAPLGINPHRGNGDVTGMYQDWAAEKNGRAILWNPNGWGCAFGKLKGLKELEMELETSDDKRDELMAIVEKAKTWRFPLKGGLVLSAEGMPVSTSMWQTSMCYWSGRCPYCGEASKCKKAEPANKGCEERMRLRAEEKGPICHIVSLRWKVVSATDRH